MKKNMKKLKKEPKINLMQWLVKLKPYEMEFLREYKMVEYEEERNFLIDQLDMCYSAALIEEMDLQLDNVELILARASQMLAENADMLKEYGRREYYMQLSKLEEDVKKRMKKLISDGFKQNEIIKRCRHEFTTLKSSHLNNAYKKVLEEHLELKRKRDGEMSKNTEVMDWLIENENEVLNQDKKITLKKIKENFDLTEATASTYYYRWKKQAISKNSIPAQQKKKVAIENSRITNAKAKDIAEQVAAQLEEELSSSKIEDNKNENETKTSANNLTVISRSLVVQGKYGDYILSDNGLKAGEFTFTSKEGVENYYKQEIDKLNDRVNEYRAVFDLA